MNYNSAVRLEHNDIFFLFGDTALPVGQGLLIHEFSRSQSTAHHSR